MPGRLLGYAEAALDLGAGGDEHHLVAEGSTCVGESAYAGGAGEAPFKRSLRDAQLLCESLLAPPAGGEQLLDDGICTRFHGSGLSVLLLQAVWVMHLAILAAQEWGSANAVGPLCPYPFTFNEGRARGSKARLRRE